MFEGDKRGSMIDASSGESKKPRGVNRMLPRRASRRTLAELQTEVKLLSAKTANPGKANTLVMRTLETIAKKYAAHGEDTLPLMQELLSTQTGIMFFSNHLAGEYSSENIQFWEAVRDFPQNPSLKECTRIVDLYIRENAEFEVNILQLVRQQILEEYQELGDTEPDPAVWVYKKNLFELAKNEVFGLMHRDSFPRFRRSRLYRLYKQKLALDTAIENRTEHKNRVNCGHPRCPKEGRMKGFCAEHEMDSSPQGALNQLAQVLHGIDSQLTLQMVLDHPLGSSFFAHYCSLELKTAGETRLQGLKQRTGINPVHYFNCYKLILEFKQSGSYNAASLIVANHLEKHAPCAVSIEGELRTTILKAVDQSRNSAKGGNSSTRSSVHPGEQPLEVFAEKFADEVDPLPADTFEEVTKVILEALDPVFSRFEASRWYVPCKTQMRDWDVSMQDTGSPSLKATTSPTNTSTMPPDAVSVKEIPPLSL